MEKKDLIALGTILGILLIVLFASGTIRLPKTEPFAITPKIIQGSGKGDSSSPQQKISKPFFLGIIGNSNCNYPGYDNCWDKSHTNCYGSACANCYAKIASSTPDTKTCTGLGKYVLDEYSINYICEGDKFFIKKGTTDFPSCDKNGCSSTSYPKSGSFNLAYAPSKLDYKIAMQCHDYTYASSGGYWAWAYAWAGYTYSASNIYVLKCCTDSECGYGKLCDKRNSDYKTWKCIDDPCLGVTCEDKCVGDIRYYNGYCDWGTCKYSTQNCDDNNICTTDTCSKNACIHNKIPGCCNTNNDCLDVEMCSYNQCIKITCPTEITCKDKQLFRKIPSQHKCLDYPIQNVECCGDIDCDDSNICTTDICRANICSNIEIEDCCVDGETKTKQCKDGTIITTHICKDNMFIETSEECKVNVFVKIWNWILTLFKK